MTQTQQASEPMTPTQQAKEMLSRYLPLKLENENRLEKLARLRSKSELPSHAESDGSHSGGQNAHRMENSIEAMIEYAEETKLVLEANLAEMRRIEKAVREVKDPIEREVLWLLYLDSESVRPMGWRKIARRIYGSDEEKDLRAVFRVHGEALVAICLSANVSDCR